ncbi:hypothetical protein ISS04_02115 [Candidatus Woesearchaeota archaeon]|nr:hypothetical protein [Candidatus Woesearchaeota archaeon]
MHFTLKKLSYTLVLIFVLFEAVALFFIDVFNINTQTTTALIPKFFGGLLTGFFTAFIAITLLNLILKIINRIKIKSKTNQKTKLKFKKINPLAPSIFNALFLAILFVIESLLSPIKHTNLILGNAIVGTITTPLSIYIILTLYNKQDKLKAHIYTTKKQTIKNINAENTAIFAAIYEVIALPIMALLMTTKTPYIIIGAIAGLTSIITITLYNKLPKKRKIKFIF